MGNKPDIQEVNEAARRAGLTPAQRKEFGRYLERCKRDGDGGTKNDRGDFTWDELMDRAQQFREGAR